ncbi:cytochrome P450 [Nocardia sp. NPDC060256]|uniref:cytochrome P450 family protein n=1 Tax=unclassified Nocardia TaxID=2637762 RepID=UPI00364A20E8
MTQSPVELTPEQVSDHVGGYTELRKQGPLANVVLPGTVSPTWFVTHFEDIKALLTDTRFVRDHSKIPDVDIPHLGIEMLKAWDLPLEYGEYLTSLVVIDGPEHSRLRAKVIRTFSARRINALRPSVEQVADTLLKELDGRDEIDLMADFAYPLANAAICDLIGVEEADQEKMRGWILQYVSGSEPVEIVAGLQGVVNYTKELIQRRREAPTDDLISSMIADHDPATEAEMIAMVFLLINTGHTPPVLFLCTALLALLDHPEQLARLRADHSLMPKAIHELLRYTTPVTVGATAYATEDLEFAGVQLKRGESVTTAFLAADHDPTRFAQPERLDIDRAPSQGEQHLAFGAGAHYCLGAALARMQAEIALDRLLFRRDSVALAVGRDELEYGSWPGDGTHLVRLPVRI